MYEIIVNHSDRPPCRQCAPHVGQRYLPGEGPYPPFHPNCHCERIPEDLAPMNEQLFRTQPAKGLTGHVDRDNRILFGVSCAQAVEALGHNVLLDEQSIAQVVALGNAAAKGIKSRYTHPGLSSDGLGKYLGRLRNFRPNHDGTKALADLHLADSAFRSPDGNIGDYILDLAEQDPDAFGLSIVFKGPRVWLRPNGEELDADKHTRPDDATTDKPIVRVHILKACDCVDEPAANRDGLFSASNRDTNTLAADLFDHIDNTIAQLGVSHAHAWRFAQHYFHQRGIPMDNQNPTPTQLNQPAPASTDAPPDAAAPHPDVWSAYIAQQALEAALSASRLPPLNQDAVRRNLAGKRFTPAHMDEEIAFQRQIVAQFATNPVRGVTPTIGDSITTVGDELQAAFDWIFGVPTAPLPKPHLRRLADVYQAITGDHQWTGQFQPDFTKFAAANSTTMAGMATNSVNKVVMSHYEGQMTYRWFENIVEVVAHDGSTHDIDMITIDGITNLPTVAEGAAYTEATTDDAKETMAFSKKGVYIGITLELIRKNQVEKARKLVRGLVMSSIRTRSASIAGIFTQASGVGPTLADDSTVLFHSNHGNLSTTAFSSAEWALCRNRIFSQTVPGTSSPLGLWPRFVLLPSELYDTGLTLFGYGDGDVGKPNSAGTAQEVNPYAQSRMGDPRPIPIPVPEWTDTNDFAYITDPREHAPIQMAYANAPGGGSHPAPEVFQVQSESAGLMFTNDTLPVKIRDWFAYGVATYIGIGKNNVT